ncbi:MULTISPECIES: chemotaxis response regulator protein-glutamate methylesterase [unclassified Haladaptatus]|uniref:protein-glutamate methylesterase/protein-glutamine glutaminase n=1 Tax=unclassified Haladaptatus TaxID=2622732 RepID=UPI00209C5152|nr:MULTISPECIES: chemotaxis response regulator protein-glutamate methylesterase [unclassified Haladaptatus]MCO8245257.1 chemotaxis response regulator protein-glutamate methylesterase [Haladaptatus sp. AB643]MCO8253402.1 chemotaxis response regulator protein-glutamate methylesterase [Haladaptatus sp. AB618]
MTRAVVVDDSHFMRTVITDVLESDGIDVVAQASNGEEAVSVVAEHEPDVVTMDVEMPKMNGIEAVEEIMERSPTPILMLSAHTEEGAEATFEALDRGAIDVLAKPGGEVSTGISAHKDALVAKVRSVVKADVSVSVPDNTMASPANLDDSYVENATVVIGASTGGPRVVESVLAGLPRSAQLRILIVQHMPDSFTTRFAKRLDNRTEYDVKEATDGDRIGAGQALVARGDYHMEVSNYAKGRLRVRLTQDEVRHGVRPAIDVTMESAAAAITDPLTAVVLTGMGADGAVGVEAIKTAGGRTIAQDEATCSVFGIPARAIETGCVDTVLPADEVARGILSTVRKPT